MTAPVATSPERLQQLQEAADWVVRLSDPSRTESDVNDWLRWCDGRRGNLETFELVQHDWHAAAALKLQKPASKRPARTLRSLAGAALALACLVASVSLWLWHRASPATYESGAMTRAATLPDGSSVTLSARTVVHVNFAPSQRYLAMSHGEAYFKVRHDPARRFVVDAGELQVTAAGTAFDVRRDADLTTVTVEEGIVEIASGLSAPGASPGEWRVGAGYQLVYRPQTGLASLTHVDSSRALQWRSGQLDYLGTSLNRVLDDVNRYSDRRIVLADSSLGRLPYSGTVFVQSIDDWLQALTVVYPVQVRRSADGTLVLERTRH
jgi:transmembrane sensor